jgi:S1-C subfamily serine protease
MAVTNPPLGQPARDPSSVAAAARTTPAPTPTTPPHAPERRWRGRILPKSVLGISALILAFSLGASLSGVVLYSYYEYRLGQNQDKVNTFINGFKDTVNKAQDSIKAQQNAATNQIQSELAPIKQIAAEGATLQGLLTKAAPALYFVHTLDQNGAASVGSAFAVASDSHQTLLITSYTTVKAATRQPGPDVFVRHGTSETKVSVYTWQVERDLALIILPVGNQPKLDFAPNNPSIGDRVFALSGLGAQGGAITQGLVADVSSAGIQHDAPIGPAFQGGPLVNTDGKVLAIDSQAYAPLGFTTNGVWFAIPGKAACEKVLSCPNSTPAAAGAQGGN